MKRHGNIDISGNLKLRGVAVDDFTTQGGFYSQQFGETLYDRGSANYLNFTEQATNPPVPGSTQGVLWAEDNNGHTVLHWMDDQGATDEYELGRDNVFIVRNVTGSTLARGTVVYVSGSTGNVPQVTPAKADKAATMPAFGITAMSIANNAFGRVMVLGKLSGIDTSSFSQGDVLWVSATTAGSFTTTRPSSPNLAQQVGLVLSSGVSGEIVVNVLSVDRDPGPGFYGVYFRETDGNPRAFRNDTLTFDSASFYLHPNSVGKPIVSFRSSGNIIDHGALTGLADNDHPQYARLAAQANNFTGVIYAEAFYLEHVVSGQRAGEFSVPVLSHRGANPALGNQTMGENNTIADDVVISTVLGDSNTLAATVSNTVVVGAFNSIASAVDGANCMGVANTVALTGGIAIGSGTSVQDGVSIGITANASGSGAVAIGPGAVASGNNSFSLGFNTSVSSAGGIGMGNLVSASGGGNPVCIGNLASASGGGSPVAIGAASVATGNASVAIGASASTAGFARAIAIKATATAADQASFGIHDMFIGPPTQTGAVTAKTLQITNRTGTNVAAGDFTIRGGLGTGTGTTGDLIVSTGVTAAAGTTAHTFGERVRFNTTEVNWNRDQLNYDFRFQTVNKPYMFYIDSSSNNVGFDVNAPSAKVHLGAGSATAKTAPLKFSPGTVLTTPEQGTMEYDGKLLYFTNFLSRRRVELSSDVVTSDTSASNTTVETTLFSVTINPNSRSVGDTMRINTMGIYSAVNDTSSVHLRLKLNSTTMLTSVSNRGRFTNVPWMSRYHATIRSIGAGGTIIAFGETDFYTHTNNSAPTTTTTIDTTVSNTISVTAQWDTALSGNTITRQQGVVEFL